MMTSRLAKAISWKYAVGEVSLISNDALRLRLVDLYESTFPSLESATENDRIFSRDQVLPYFYTHFRRSDDGLWTPVSGYASLGADVYFENLVAAKLDRLQGFVIPNYDEFFGITEEVLLQVTNEIGNNNL